MNSQYGRQLRTMSLRQLVLAGLIALFYGGYSLLAVSGQGGDTASAQEVVDGSRLQRTGQPVPAATDSILADQLVASDSFSSESQVLSDEAVTDESAASAVGQAVEPPASAVRPATADEVTDDVAAGVAADTDSDDAGVDPELEGTAELLAVAPIVSSPPVSKLPQAKSVELNEPVITPAIVGQENVIAPVVEGTPEDTVDTEAVDAPAASQPEQAKPLVILGTEILPSTSTRLSWSPNQSFEGITTPTPVLIVNGAKAGPVLCLTAALHGDELNGIEIVRRVLYNLQPDTLVGSVIGVPIVNLQGFRRSSRYLTDRRDLNRYFPGNPQGSSASRIAYSFFTEVISHCDALVDLHTGSFYRTNLPQLRADVSNARVVELAQGFGSTVVLQSGGAPGTLRRAAVEAGIPAVTLEAGESMRLQEQAVEHGVKGIHTLMNKMGMTQKFSLWGDPEPVYYNSMWVRADLGGILFSDVELGDRVEKGDLLGEVTDPITNIKNQITAPKAGRVIGMALNQVVLPGFAAFHLGMRAPEASISEPDKTAPEAPHVSQLETAPVTDTTEDTDAAPATAPLMSAMSVENSVDDISNEEIDEDVIGSKQADVDEYD